MKFSLRAENRAEDNLFEPIRELRSPISMEKIKAVVYHHATGGISLWSQLRGLLGEFLAVGAVSAIAVNFSGFSSVEIRDTSVPEAIRSIIATSTDFAKPTTYHYRQANSSIPFNSTGHSIITAAMPSDILPSKSTANISPVTRFRSEDAARIAPRNNEVENYLQPSLSGPMPSPGMEWFSTLSSGAVFSHIRMLGENAEIGLQKGWESVGLSLTNANGNRNTHEVLEHHSMASSASSLLFSENDQTIALLLGANFSLGPIAIKGELGPAYVISSTKFIDPVTDALSPSSVNGRIGAAAEVLAFYNISDFFQAGVTGISSYRTGQFTSGIMISVNIRP